MTRFDEVGSWTRLVWVYVSQKHSPQIVEVSANDLEWHDEQALRGVVPFAESPYSSAVASLGVS
jgi:hypothetical protein